MTSSVDSRISPKRYESLLSEIEEEDQNIKSDLYELSIYDHTIHISPGKTIQDDDIKDLVYCYVYAVKNDKVVQKLGIYERFTKEKEPFFDLTTFDKGTLCLFEKYETNPSLFLEFKTDMTEKVEKKKKKPKSKVSEVEVKAEIEPYEVDLNAVSEPKVMTEPKVMSEPKTMSEPKAMTEPKVMSEPKDPNEVDLNAEAEDPNEVDLNAEDPNEVDLNAETKPSKSEKKPSVPKLLDVDDLERELPSQPEKKTKTRTSSKIKLKTPKSEIPSVEAETKAKPRTKKTKPIVDSDPMGTKFG